MTRVLQVSSFMPPHPGGLELAVQNLVAGLRDREHEVRWIASAVPMNPGTDGHLIRVAAWQRLEHLIHVPLPFWGPSGYKELLQQIRWADVVHTHDCLYPSSVAAVLLAQSLGKPVVITQHIGMVPYGPMLSAILQAAYRSIGRSVLEIADRVVSYSSHVPAFFQTLGVRRAFDLIPLGFDERFRPLTPVMRQQLRVAYGLGAASKIVLFAGRLVPKKGIDQVIEVQRTLAREGVHLLVAGDGALAPRLATLPNTTHLRVVPYARMHELYALADALLLPSHGEGLALTVQEALLTGLPSVVSRDPSFTANLHGAPGVWMSEPGEALIAATRSALSQPDARESIASWARARWGKEAFVGGYERVYMEVLLQRNPEVALAAA